MGTINTFYSRINQQIDNSGVVKELFNPVKPENFPSLSKLASQAIKNAEFDLSRYPESTQELFSHNTNWLTTQHQCLPLVVKNVAALVVKQKLVRRPKDSERILLNHLFERMLAKCSLQEKNEILTNYRKAQSLKTFSKNSVVHLKIKTLEICSKALLNPRFMRIFTTTIAMTINLAVCPIFALLQVIFLYLPIEILFPSYHLFIQEGNFVLAMAALSAHLLLAYRIPQILHTFTQQKIPLLNQWVFRPVHHGVDWLFFGPGYLIVHIENTILNSAPILAKKFQERSKKMKGKQITIEYRQARDLWVQTFLNERQKQRTEIEKIYAIAKNAS